MTVLSSCPGPGSVQGQLVRLSYRFRLEAGPVLRFEVYFRTLPRRAIAARVIRALGLAGL